MSLFVPSGCPDYSDSQQDVNPFPTSRRRLTDNLDPREVEEIQDEVLCVL